MSTMIALAAAYRAPHRVAALLGAMTQEHERGLGNWPAEQAEWAGLFVSAHGAVHALAEAAGGLQVDPARMLKNIDALQGLVFAEAVSLALAQAVGRSAAHSLMEDLTRKAVSDGRHLLDVVLDELRADAPSGAKFGGKVTEAGLRALFDPVAAGRPASRIGRDLLDSL
jgi:3-carboxy-cis,cis-muconate cycloisomerase